MSALTAARNFIQLGDNGPPRQLALKVKASTKVFVGALTVIDAGYAAPGRTATGLKAAGVATAKGGNFTAYDNSTGAAGAVDITVDRGAFNFQNSAAADAIAQADVGNVCYIVDDQTVAKTDGGATRSQAGIILGLHTDGTIIVLVTGASTL